MSPRDFFAELKRRNVYKVAVAYAVVGWLVMQVAATVVPALHLPGAITSAVVLLTILGFPIALVLAWAFEMTPEGIKRTEDVAPNQSIARRTGRRITALIVVLALAALGLFLFQIVRGRSHTASTATPSPALAPTQPANQKSVAVLPFTDLSAARDQEYFGDGLAEELLNVLVQIDGLSVASRTSSFAFKGKNLAIPEIARTLGVAHIVEGSVRRAGDRLRVTAQLIDVGTDRHLWSQTFDRQATDIFTIQDEIARSIAEALKVRLGGSAQAGAGTGDLAAYELYLRGLYHWNKRTEEGLRAALEAFQRAIERDPTFARAFAGLSMTYVLLPYYARFFDNDLAQREAVIAARRAIELDPLSAEALTALAQTREEAGAFREAVAHYDKALAVNPRFATARHWKGIALTRMGRIAEGETELRSARALDPASLPIQSYLGLNLAYQGRFADALAEALDLLQRAPDYRNGLHQAFVHGVMLGRRREHLPFLERYFRVIGEDSALASTILDAFDAPENRPEAVAALEKIAPKHYNPGEQNQIAQLFALLKAEAQTLELLGHNDRGYPLYPHGPVYEFLRGHPRYEALLAKAKRRAEEGPAAPEETEP